MGFQFIFMEDLETKLILNRTEQATNLHASNQNISKLINKISLSCELARLSVIVEGFITERLVDNKIILKQV